MFCLRASLPVLKIKLSKELNHCSGSSTTIQNAADRQFFEEWLFAIVESGKVVQVDPPVCKTLSPHIVVVSGGKRRLVGNFKGLNRLTVEDSFVGASISVVVPACAKFMFHTKIDLKLGFNHVLVDPDCRSLLSFSYGGNYFCYNVMPLGISSGPFTFDGWAKEFVRVQQFLTSKIFYYQDDFLLNDHDPLRLYHSTLIFVFLLMFCAKAIVNWEKSVLVPTVQLNALGSEISYHFYALSEELHAIKKLTENPSHDSSTYHNIQIIIGTTESIAMIEAVRVPSSILVSTFLPFAAC